MMPQARFYFIVNYKSIYKAKRQSINEKFSYYHKNLLPRSKRSIYHLFNDIFGKSSTILSNKSTFSNNHNLGYYVCTLIQENIQCLVVECAKENWITNTFKSIYFVFYMLRFKVLCYRL